MTFASPATKKARILTIFNSQPLLPREAIAEYCGVSVASVSRILRSYKRRNPFQVKHGNSAEARKFIHKTAGYQKYFK